MNIRSLIFVAALFFSSLSPLVAESPSSILVENISTEEYCAFLNAVETTGTHGFYHPEMVAVMPITYSLAEDGVHFIYSVVDGYREFLDITPRDSVCYSNWLYHDCPTGDAVTDEVLYTPLDPTTHDALAPFRIAHSTSTSHPARVTNILPSVQQNPKAHTSSYSPYFYNGFKAIASLTEWTIWNVGGEVVEAIVFQQLGLYALVPYCAYMGAVILHEYENREYYSAAGTILHALFDIACMLGDKIGFDVAGILGSSLEKCGLKCVADFFRAIHDKIDWLLHTFGIEHSHGGMVEDTAAIAPLRQEIADKLETFADGTSPTAASLRTAPAAQQAVPGAGWATHQHKGSCCQKKT